MSISLWVQLHNHFTIKPYRQRQKLNSNQIKSKDFLDTGVMWEKKKWINHADGQIVI